MNTFADLDFIIPLQIDQLTDIPKTFLYTDDIPGGSSIVDYLNAKIAHMVFKDWGLVWPYNAAMSIQYCQEVMKLFKKGIVRVLVCTDAAGMVSVISSPHRMQ